MSNFNMRPNYRPRGPSTHDMRSYGIRHSIRTPGGRMHSNAPRPSFQGNHSSMRYSRPQMRTIGPHFHQRPMHPNSFKHKPNNEGWNRKRRSHAVDLSRPWVNDTLRADVAMKDSLFQKAKASNHEEDWAEFKELKDKCLHMYSVLKNEYIGLHPDEVFSPNEDPDEYVCEACDRAFDDEEPYRAHLSEHQTCGIDGCKFNAHQLLVLAHIKMQHSSGLYDKIRNISTPEDIEKWRAERKKNYPSKANIEQRYKQQVEMLKRGERIGPNKDRFGRIRKEKQQTKKELVKKKKKKRKVPAKKDHATVSLIDEKADWNGSMFPFKGTSFIDDSEQDEENDEFSDDEWVQKEAASAPVEKVKLNNALGALMGAYNSDNSDSDTEAQPTKGLQQDKVLEHEVKQGPSTISTERIPEGNDNEGNIVEEKILKVPVQLPDKATENRKRPIPISAIPPDDVPVPPRKMQKQKNKVAPPLNNVNRRPTLLQKLLNKEIRHERNIILQCVRYIVNNNFFDEPGTSSS